ncbi:MAG: nicotinate phosphoribosyltransferase [Planctomycetota bacterium]|nr:nicotinate phosphoribosyltransferase [Planctomycetota bacterium]
MTLFDGRRLTPAVFAIDPRMAHGRYTDRYFINARNILARLADEGYRFAGESPAVEAAGLDTSGVDVGNLAVEMQCFTKREPLSIACGTDHAIAILKTCAGYADASGEFHNTSADLEVEAVPDGARLAPWAPALKIRGRYRDFAMLETPLLGVLARPTRVATNTYEALTASGGKPVFFFPARFDLPVTQPADGYAYKVGVDAYNHAGGADVPAMITTEAQGQWWGGRGGGTVSHSYVIAFLHDAAEAMLHFARLMPPQVKRVALVDTRGDCVTDTVRVALALFRRWWDLSRAGRAEEAERYVLFGVRADTAEDVRDASVEPTGDPARDCGVVPRLVQNLRSALDDLHESPDVPDEAREAARDYFRAVRIVASGGFEPQRIARFERDGAAVDVYGVGSYFLRGPTNDFTADVVRVRIDGRWVDLAKTGRRPVANPDLEAVKMGG